MIKLRRWKEVRMGKRRKAYLSVSGKYEEWRLRGRLGVVDGIEINWFLRKRSGMKWDR
jgi:hypothetical protein